MLINQRIRGSEVTEMELFTRMLENIRSMRDCSRGLALKRGDERWLLVARNMEALEDSTKRLMHARQQPYILLPR